MKKFYTQVAVQEHPSGFAIELDGKSVRTPKGLPVAVPVRSLADVLAAEWEAQDEKIKPLSMPLTRIVNTVIDGVQDDPAPVVRAIVDIAGSDLLCYRADEPEELVQRQHEAWQPLLDWARERHGLSLAVTEGVMHVDQPDEALTRVGAVLSDLDPYSLAAAHMMATLTGSAVITLAMLDGTLDEDDAWRAACVDETWQTEQWGADEEAEARLKRRRAELAHAMRLAKVMGAEVVGAEQ